LPTQIVQVRDRRVAAQTACGHSYPATARTMSTSGSIPIPWQGIDFADANRRRHILDPGAKHLAVPPATTRSIFVTTATSASDSIGPTFSGRFHAARRFEHDHAQPAVHVGRAAQTKAGRLDHEHRAVRLARPFESNAGTITLQ